MTCSAVAEEAPLWPPRDGEGVGRPPSGKPLISILFVRAGKGGEKEDLSKQGPISSTMFTCVCQAAKTVRGETTPLMPAAI